MRLDEIRGTMFRFNHIEGMDTTCVRITGELVVTSEERARGLAPCHRATFYRLRFEEPSVLG